jgi:hypothetical protein
VSVERNEREKNCPTEISENFLHHVKQFDTVRCALHHVKQFDTVRCAASAEIYGGTDTCCPRCSLSDLVQSWGLNFRTDWKWSCRDVLQRLQCQLCIPHRSNQGAMQHWRDELFLGIWLTLSCILYDINSVSCPLLHSASLSATVLSPRSSCFCLLPPC